MVRHKKIHQNVLSIDERLNYKAGSLLMQELLAPVMQGKSHILTCLMMTGNAVSTSIDTFSEITSYEHPQVISIIGKLIRHDLAYVLTLRTFLPEISYYLESGHPIPCKEIRAWHCQGIRCTGLNDAEVFDAYCTDNATGEPVPPERDENYVASWDITVDI